MVLRRIYQRDNRAGPQWILCSPCQQSVRRLNSQVLAPLENLKNKFSGFLTGPAVLLDFKIAEISIDLVRYSACKHLLS